MRVRLRPWTSLEKISYEMGHSVVEFCIKISRHLTDFQHVTNFHCLLNEVQMQ